MNNLESTNNLDYNLAYEKLFIPENYYINENYTTDYAFAISNESLNELFKNLNLKNKKILTVGSSGDQALNSILKGSKDVTIIDANIFSQPYIEYKIAFIKTFDYKTFSNLFIKNEFFDWRIYSKISHHLSPNSKMFWDSIMLDLSENNYDQEFSGKTIKDKMLFVDHSDRHSSFYNNEHKYNKLQSLLNKNDVKISFITAELQDFPKILTNKYDMIYLSNIYDYCDESQFEAIISQLHDSNLNRNGLFFVNYDFCETANAAPSQIGNYPLHHIQVSRNLYGEKVQDTAWFIKKTTTTYPIEKDIYM